MPRIESKDIFICPENGDFKNILTFNASINIHKGKAKTVVSVVSFKRNTYLNKEIKTAMLTGTLSQDILFWKLKCFIYIQNKDK